MSTVARMMADVAAPPLAATDEAIDMQHLSRMTLGERSLEREVLALFERQAELLLERMAQSERAVVATAAHTLKGSAQGIGAWRVALAAEAVEYSDAAGQSLAVDALADAVEEARAAIGRLLAAH